MAPYSAWRRTGTAAAIAVAVLLCARAPLAGAADSLGVQRRAVQDPYYGVALYDFYREHYFSSLAELMVDQHFGRLPHHAEDAEVLRGGLYLSYGLHREAAEIFTRLIDRGAPPPVRDRAWYYLAKIRYQRGFSAEAEDALGRIKGELPPDLQEDRVLLASNLLMARGDYAGAATLLQPLAKKGGAALYARYNLGVALIRSGSDARGSELLDEIGVTPAATDEFRSLRDKANVALGFNSLKKQDAERARFYLERVRLDGMLADKALLGFGWADDALHLPKDAMVPWSELAARDTSDPAVLEAKLALPYAMAEVGANAQSMEYYGKAIVAFEQESANLDESIAAIRAGSLLTGLLASNPGDEMGWFWSIDRLPRMPHAGHLASVLAEHEFQEGFKNYRDLQFLARNLSDWDAKLSILQDMLANRREAFAARLPRVRAAGTQAAIADLEKRRDRLGAELAGAGESADGRPFADARERALDVRLGRVRAILDRNSGDPQFDEARERYRRAAGALGWDLAEEFPARFWDAKKDFERLRQELEHARERDARLAQAGRDEPARFEDFDRRIGTLHDRIIALQPRVADLLQRQQHAVQELAVTVLREQQERLAVYSNQARFAVAQLYDRAGRAPESDHAAAK